MEAPPMLPDVLEIATDQLTTPRAHVARSIDCDVDADVDGDGDTAAARTTNGGVTDSAKAAVATIHFVPIGSVGDVDLSTQHDATTLSLLDASPIGKQQPTTEHYNGDDDRHETDSRGHDDNFFADHRIDDRCVGGLGDMLRLCMEQSPSLLNISSLNLSSCGLHDEDISTAFHASGVLPHLFLLDLSDNLLQTFPTFVLRRLDTTVVTADAAGSSVSALGSSSTRKPISPWIWNVSRNRRMRLFPPMILECEIMGSISLSGCDQIMPNVVVAGLKGLVCGEVYLPHHTDETAVFESMLGLLAINGHHVQKRRGMSTSSADILGPQHARKCESHLQGLRRRYMSHATAMPSQTYVLQLLDAIRLQVATRHVDHPRLVERHLRLVEQTQEAFIIHQLSAAHFLSTRATHKFDPHQTPHHGYDSIDAESMRYATDVPPTLVSSSSIAVEHKHNNTTVSSPQLFYDSPPLNFPVWRSVLIASESSGGEQHDSLPFFDSAVCVLIGHSVFPQLFPHALAIVFVDRILEECLSQQANAQRCGDGRDGQRTAILSLCDTVGWWPALVFDSFVRYLCQTSANHTSTEHVMCGNIDDGVPHWSSNYPASPSDLPLERLLLAAQALGIGRSAAVHRFMEAVDDEAVVAALAAIEDIVSQSNAQEESRMAAAASLAKQQREMSDLSVQEKHNRSKLCMTPASSQCSIVHVPQPSRRSPPSRDPCTPAPSKSSNISPDIVAEPPAPVVHNGFLPMRSIPSGQPSTPSPHNATPSLAEEDNRGGGAAGHVGAFRLVDPRRADPLSAARMSQRHLNSNRHPRNLGSLRPNTQPAAFLLSENTGSTARALPRAGSAASHHLETLESRRDAQHRTSGPSSHALCDDGSVMPPATFSCQRRVESSRTLMDFLQRRGVLRSQSASAARDITRAIHLDLSEFTSAVAPERPSSVACTPIVASIDHSAPASTSKAEVVGGVSAPRSPSRGSDQTLKGGPTVFSDVQSVRCSLGEFQRAQRLYNSNLPNQSEPRTPLHIVLSMIYRLMNVSSRQPGQVLRVFMSVLCAHALGEATRLRTEAPEWCEWICRDLQHRGELRDEHEWIVDEILMSCACQLEHRTSASSLQPIGFSSEIVSERLSSGPDAPAAAVGSMQRVRWESDGADPCSSKVLIHPKYSPSKVNLKARCDSALECDLRTLSTVIAQSRPISVVGANPKSIRVAPQTLPPRGGADVKRNQLADVSAAHLVERGAHPFTVHAQQAMERERLKCHIRAASAEPADSFVAKAVQRSCSASLRPMRHPPRVATGRDGSDWIATNTQFLPTVVRDHITGNQHTRRR